MILHGGRHFLNVHQDRGIAGNIDHQSFGMRHLNTDGSRQAVSHGSEAARRHPTIGLVEMHELGGPHLVLANLGGDVGVIVLGELMQALECMLRHDHIAGGLVGQRFAAAPAVDFLPPPLQRWLVDLHGFRLPRPDQVFQDIGTVADDRDIGANVLVDR